MLIYITLSMRIGCYNIFVHTTRIAGLIDYPCSFLLQSFYRISIKGNSLVIKLFLWDLLGIG